MASFDKKGLVSIDTEKLGDKFYEKAMSCLNSKNPFKGKSR